MSGLPGAISTKQTDPPSFFSCPPLTLSLSREPLLYPCHALVGLALDLCRGPQLLPIPECIPMQHQKLAFHRCPLHHQLTLTFFLQAHAQLGTQSRYPQHFDHLLISTSAVIHCKNKQQTNKQKPPVNKRDLLRPKLRAMKICGCKHTCLECTLAA